MEIVNYITQNALILIPVLLIIGQIIKNINAIPDKWIPLLLLPFGIAGAVLLGGAYNIDNVVHSVIQGVLVTGAAVYGNQIVKQIRKDE